MANCKNPDAVEVETEYIGRSNFQIKQRLKNRTICIEQGEQVFTALKRLGVDTEMVRFPDESHGLSRIGRTDRRIVRLRHILRWFDRYLKA